jgi:hypothetical protein
MDILERNNVNIVGQGSKTKAAGLDDVVFVAHSSTSACR